MFPWQTSNKELSLASVYKCRQFKRHWHRKIPVQSLVLLSIQVVPETRQKYKEMIYSAIPPDSREQLNCDAYTREDGCSRIYCPWLPFVFVFKMSSAAKDESMPFIAAHSRGE